DVTFVLGDSSLPTAPLQGGSFTVSSVGAAVLQACQVLRSKVLEHARMAYPALASLPVEDVRFADGHLHFGNQRIALADIAATAEKGCFEIQIDAEPSTKRDAFSTATHSAVFVEVQVDEALGTIKVRRVVSAIAAGRVVNPKTARSQILGGVVWGLGMALQEQSQTDHALGRILNHNLAEYHIPVNADVADVEVIFVDEQDDIVNELGSKGVGEIGVVGVAAAVANAVYHATGKRIRAFPITLDTLL
ncbi:MAG TPA: aldehyde oxidase, partial [Pseudomonas sp.]|nr:aldehyde oxidase [Pseudomonas sp.]